MTVTTRPAFKSITRAPSPVPRAGNRGASAGRAGSLVGKLQRGSREARAEEPHAREDQRLVAALDLAARATSMPHLMFAMPMPPFTYVAPSPLSRTAPTRSG